MNLQKGFISVLVLIVVVLALAAGGYYVTTQMKNDVKVDTETQVVTLPDTQPAATTSAQIETSGNTTVSPNVQKPTQPISAQIKVAATVDCGFNTACLLAAAKNNCAKAKVVQEVKTEHPFVAMAQPGLSKISARSYYEIKGKEGSNCIIYEKFLGGQMTYDQAKLAQLSVSDPSIKVQADAVLESYTAANTATAGKDATCKVTAADLQTRITDAAEGSFSINISSDLSGNATNNDPYAKKCSGPLYQISPVSVKNNTGTSACTLKAPPSYNYNTGAETGVQTIELFKGVSINVSADSGTSFPTMLEGKVTTNNPAPTTVIA